MHKKMILSLFVLVFLLAACGPAASQELMMDKSPTEEAMMDKAPTEEAMMDKTPTEEAMMTAPDWFGVEFQDAGTGQLFSIKTFDGKVVLVETLAMWCPNCRAQQEQVAALHDLLGERDDLISIGIDIDPNEQLADLKSYVESNGFDWLYAVATPEVAREIGQLYGEQFLSPPSTPMLIIDRHGEAHLLPFGIKSAQDLLDALKPYLDGDM